jgi:hypothetical protein
MPLFDGSCGAIPAFECLQTFFIDPHALWLVTTTSAFPLQNICFEALVLANVGGGGCVMVVAVMLFVIELLVAATLCLRPLPECTVFRRQLFLWWTGLRHASLLRTAEGQGRRGHGGPKTPGFGKVS